MTKTSPLKLLFDSNVFYAAEDVSVGRQHKDAPIATRLLELAHSLACEVFVAEATKRDITRTSNAALKKASLLKLRQWKILPSPTIPATLQATAGYLDSIDDNDAVDLELLALVDIGAVDVLVTQDNKLREHAAAADLEDRVLAIATAIEYLEGLEGTRNWFPTVTHRVAYELDQADPIFDSLRDDYDEFDDWLRDKVVAEHRDCLTIESADGKLEALAILKDEAGPYGTVGSALKVCTFKVADFAQGSKRGELLLKAALDHAHSSGIELMYVEVNPKHESVLRFVTDFGFVDHGFRAANGDLALVKELCPPFGPHPLAPLKFHRKFGPPAVQVETPFVVPIKPRWHRIIFPEAEQQLTMSDPSPVGNAIRKAYLSGSESRQITAGATLLFYRSSDVQGVTAIGVVDGVMRSSDPVEIRRAVGQRTVYTDEEIAGMCAGGRDVLVLLFRHDRILGEPWLRSQLIDEKVIAAAPQSIVQVRDTGAVRWVQDQLAAGR